MDFVNRCAVSISARRGGTIVIVGNVQGDVPFYFRNLCTAEIKLKTTKRYCNDFQVCLSTIATGGLLVAGLIIGHFGHVFGLDLTVEKKTADFFRELGLCLFLIGAGVPGGASFMQNVKLPYFLIGMGITLVPMAVGYLFGRFVCKFRIFQNLASITGDMTSAPALGTLTSAAGTDEIAGCYAATYPVALVLVVLSVKLLPLLLGAA